MLDLIITFIVWGLAFFGFVCLVALVVCLCLVTWWAREARKFNQSANEEYAHRSKVLPE